MRSFKELPGDKDGGRRKPGDLDAKVISLKEFTKKSLRQLSVVFYDVLKVLIHEHETCFQKSQTGLQIITKPFNPE